MADRKLYEGMSPADVVAEFQIAFDTSKDPELWVNLVKEEVEEAVEALGAFLKEMQDVRYVVLGLQNMAGPARAADMIEESGDKFVSILGALTAIEEKLFPRALVAEAFLRVHESNMSKLGEDGKPIRREDGKVLKGPNYRAPDMRSLLVS